MFLLPLANAGTPLVWFGLAYPLVGTLVVSRVEDFVVRRLVPTAAPCKGRPLLLGNIVTTLLGIGLLAAAHRQGGELFGPRPLEGLQVATGLAWVAAFVLSVAIELPFFARRVGSRALSSQTVRVALAANAVSYLLIVGVYGLHWFSSPGVSARVASARSVSAADGWVYYIAKDGRSVRRVRLDGLNDQPTSYDAGRAPRGLVIQPVDERTATLYVVSGTGSRELSSGIGHARQAALPSFRKRPPWGQPVEPSYPFGYTPGASFLAWRGHYGRSAAYSSWNNSWPEFGLTLKGPEGSFSIGVSSPIAYWTWSGTTVLEDGRVVGQWGPQIVVVDIPSRRVAWLANGSGPAVLMDRPASLGYE